MESSKELELILVYNADSGFFKSIKDSLHKTLSPSTYKCRLCALTYGTIRMRDEWKTFIAKLNVPTEFLHKDEFLKMIKTHPHKIKNYVFPAIFLKKKEKISLLINHKEINKAKTLKDLMNLITEKVSKL
jgi:hypothetical protein